MDEQGRTYVKLSAAALFLYFSYALARSPILPLYAKSLGANPEVIGWVVAASTITGVIMKLPAGTFSDIFGRRLLLLIGALVFSLIPFLYPVVTAVGMLILLRFIHGNATAIFGPTASAAISDITEPDKRGVRLGLYASVQGIGQALGPLLGGFLISWKGFGAPFLVSGFIGVIGMMIVLTLQTETTSPQRRDVLHNFSTGFREVMSNRSIIMTSIAVASQMFVLGGYNAFLPIYASDVVRLEAWHIGIIFGVQTTTTLLARPLMGKLSDRIGRKPLIVAALLVCTMLMVLLPQLNRFEFLVTFGGLWGLAASVVSSVSSAFITDLAKKAHYGAAHGTFGTIFDIGEASGPIVAGLLVMHVGFGWMFAALGIQLLFITALFISTKIEGTPST